MLLTAFNLTGCAQFATNVAVQAGIQKVIDATRQGEKDGK
jgi:hypothetical protein